MWHDLNADLLLGHLKLEDRPRAQAVADKAVRDRGDYVCSPREWALLIGGPQLLHVRELLPELLPAVHDAGAEAERPLLEPLDPPNEVVPITSSFLPR